MHILDELANDEIYWSKERCKQEILASVLVMPNGCWEWQRARLEFGYGVWSKRSLLPVKTRSTVPAHRVVAWVYLGLPEQEVSKAGVMGGGVRMVLHSCDNPPCCNPEHLYLGTAQDNVRDMMARGRHTFRRLTEKQVIQIRRLARRNLTYAEIGVRYGVPLGVARDAAIGHTFRHLVEPTAPPRPRGRRAKAGPNARARLASAGG